MTKRVHIRPCHYLVNRVTKLQVPNTDTEMHFSPTKSSQHKKGQASKMFVLNRKR
ncbi:MAG: hypothetical protein ACI9O3_001273 [Colwellia sp.]|jgi:hypothetical protein